MLRVGRVRLTSFDNQRKGLMCETAAEYRRKAEACRRLADLSPEAERKAHWIEQAAEWERMLVNVVEQCEAFEASDVLLSIRGSLSRLKSDPHAGFQTMARLALLAKRGLATPRMNSRPLLAELILKHFPAPWAFF
jgi:hypothetical protein